MLKVEQDLTLYLQVDNYVHRKCLEMQLNDEVPYFPSVWEKCENVRFPLVAQLHRHDMIVLLASYRLP